MYRNLRMEMAKLGWNKKDLADKSHINYNTLLGKINGLYPFTFDECIQIKQALKSTLTIEVLFKKD